MPNTQMYGGNPYYPTYPTPTYIPNSTFMNNVQPSLINGRSVNSVEEITAGEVPLNGSLAVFPKSDGSMIYVKSTNGNGTIDTKCYIPAPEGFANDVVPGSGIPEENSNISNQDIMNAIMNLQDQMNNLQQIVQKRPYKNNGKAHNNQNGSQERVEGNA